MCKDFEWAKRVAKLPGQICCVPRPPEELYDLTNDPNEKVNLALNQNYVQIKKNLKTKLNKWRVETGDPLLDI